MPAVNKNYMSIAVSVLKTSCAARNNGGAARQENRPQSATAYSVPRSRTAAKYSSACCNQDGGNSCKLNHRCHFAGRGIKPPKGALVKSHGTERLG